MMIMLWNHPVMQKCVKAWIEEMHNVLLDSLELNKLRGPKVTKGISKKEMKAIVKAAKLWRKEMAEVLLKRKKEEEKEKEKSD